MNLTNFAEKDGSGNTTDYRNCYTVSVNDETKWAQDQNMTFTTGDYGYPSPYGFDKYVRFPQATALDQYGVDTDAGVDETAKWYSSDVIRTDTNYTPMASYSIYYNAADNCLYVDAGRWLAGKYTNHERPDGVVVKRWKIADLGSTYDGQREAFAGFGDKPLSFSMSTTLVNGFDSVKIRILEVDGQRLGTDADGDGDLSFAETGAVYGWRNGRYFIEDVVAGKRYQQSNDADERTGTQVFSVNMHTTRDYLPKTFLANIDGVSVFTNLSTTVPTWLYQPKWNLMRITRRGISTPSEWFSCKIDYSYFYMKIR